MPTISFLSPEGHVVRVEARVGHSVMEVAVANGVNGITADCGGACTCATCHVYVEQDWFSRLPSPDEMEASMLDFSEDEVLPSSRLSCQIRITPAMDGLVVRLPK